MPNKPIKELMEQPVPEYARCPNCGAPPTEESIVQHRLQKLGYMHDDITFKCSKCGTAHLHGIPIGRGGYEDLWCGCNGDSYFLVHRVELPTTTLLPGVKNKVIILHLKCPVCYRFKKINRTIDEQYGVALVGYPQITGQMEGAKPYGWVEEQRQSSKEEK